MKPFYAYLAAATIIFCIGVQLVGIVVEYQDKQAYYQWRTEMRARYLDK